MAPLTMEALRGIRDEYFCEDLPLTTEMLSWSESALRIHFESGGVARPPMQPQPSKSSSFEVVKLFGDSHVNTFITIEATGEAAPLLAYPYTAGSAMGLRHASSITGYRMALERDLRATRPSDLIVLKFGQVDIDFVYYLKLVEQPGLRFDDFATDAVSKYMSFVDDALATLPITREQLCLMSPFATVVADAHLHDSLCTLPFMGAPFRQQFLEKLQMTDLPSLRTRTEHGTAYSRLLQAEAVRRGLKFINVHAPLLGSEGVAALPNPDRQHHLLDRHIPMLLPALDAALGGKHVRARTPQALASLPTPPTAASASALAAGAETTLEWLQLFGSICGGRLPLKLSGHVACSLRTLEQRFGPPLPLQLALPQPDAPGFATWLVRFRVPPRQSSSAATGMVRLLGRYRNATDAHAWLLECSDAALVEAICSVVENGDGAVSGDHGEDSTYYELTYEVPPRSFHQALSGAK
jgi:hypothetical protein